MNMGLYGMKPYEDTSKNQLIGLPKYHNSETSRGLYSLPKTSSASIVFRKRSSGFGALFIVSLGNYRIDYGDGTVLEVKNVTTIPTYTYPDGLTIDREVIFTVENANSLTIIGLVNEGNMLDDVCPIPFKKFPNLINLGIGGTVWKRFPDSVRYAKIEITQFQLSDYYNSIPFDLISDWPMRSFAIQGIIGACNQDASGVNKIASIWPNISALDFYGNGFSDSSCDGNGLPLNFEQLTSLTQINMRSNLFTKIPAVINRIPNLTNVGFNNLFMTPRLYDISALWTPSPMLKLATLDLHECNALPPEIPVEMVGLTALKTLYRGGALTQAYLDTLVDSMYDFITNPAKANVPITGTSAIPFRSMVISVTKSKKTTYFTPTGVYKQPAGYTQGISNGTPANQMEKIWVLEKQYGHTWAWSVNPISCTITRAGSVVTVVTASPHNFKNGITVVISGADQSPYNGNKVVSFIDDYTFTFSVGTLTPDSPATGTITVKSLN